MTVSASLPESLAGVGVTAIGVALIRARESEREDRLLDDPYARLFGDAARQGFLDPAAPAGSADTWATIERLVESFYEGRVIGVRLVDDSVRASVATGCRQVVLLGAGLDTRAFRLGFPRDVRVYEVDLPEMFAFKEPVLANRAADPTCERHVVPADLRGDWQAALVEVGFQDTVPTAWVDEGVLGYLPREKASDVVATIGRLSAPGSRFGAPRIQVDEEQPHYRELRKLAGRGESANRPPTGLGPDPEEWLNGQGWRTEFRSWNELVEPLGRAATTPTPSDGILLAIRE